jgi:hypothetical protein
MAGTLENLVGELRRGGHLDDARAGFLLRVVRGELVSVRLELQLLLYAGVLLVTAGVGILVKNHYDQLGPVAIASGLLAGAAACLVWSWRVAPSFMREAVPSPNLAFDYVLLLGLLLLGSWLAYAEYNFALLGEAWPWHLLLVSLIYLAAAYRFDSRTVLSLALTTFAAWRGVAVSFPFRWADHAPQLIRLNALGCALLFLAAGWATRRTGIKAHFEEIYSHVGLLLLFGGLLSGTIGPAGMTLVEYGWAALLAIAVWVVIVLSLHLERVSWFAYALVAAWFGFLRVIPWWSFGLGILGPQIIAASALAVILVIFRMRKRMHGEDE